MRNGRNLRAATLVFGALAVPAIARGQLGVQRQRNAPSVYAITNARIITVTGAPIERGTVVVRDGVIAAVGAAAQAPADARIIDGSGLTVYPGIIDANSSVGIAVAAAAAQDAGRGGRGGGRGAGPQQQAATAPNSIHPVGLQPELAAVDLVSAGSRGVERTAERRHHQPRSACRRAGIFRGLSAVMNLGGATSQAMIVKAPIAEHIGFTPSPRRRLSELAARRVLGASSDNCSTRSTTAPNRRRMRRIRAACVVRRQIRRSRRCSRCSPSRFPS